MFSSQHMGLACAAGLLALGTGCLKSAGAESGPSPTPAASSPRKCGSQTINFSPTISPDTSASNQLDANCFAWGQFIALNWPASALTADGGTQSVYFGKPGDLSPVQWQTYMSTDLLFQPEGAAPPPWGTQPELTKQCLDEANLTAEQARQLLPLMAASKFTEQFDDEGNSAQAFPFSGPAWLGARNGTNVWYDIRISKPEYDYIVDAGLYNANSQAAWVDGGAGKPIVLPAGSFSTDVGTIELKAAWMEVDSPQDSRWNAYKLSLAVVADPLTQKCRTTLVALVGLHIIHKTSVQPTFVWATFEHVDNAPDDKDADAGTRSWNFYDAQCKPKTLQLEARCSADGGATEVTVGCTPNVPPPYHLGAGCPAPVPIQVTRQTPLDSYAQEANSTVQQLIGDNYKDSVWKNYMLVSTLWSSSPTSSQNKTEPLDFASPMPSDADPIANTTMETYVQAKVPPSSGFPESDNRTSNCVVCHKKASIQGNSGWATDFSFVFKLASAPAASSRVKQATQTLKKKVRAVERPRLRRIIR
jgi:hypothetical protein